MSDTRGAGNDPSMDDILASIRKIISDDEARAQGGGASPATAQPSGQPSGSGGPTSPETPSSARQDDVLLLTDLVEEPKANPAVPPRPTLVPPAPKPEPVSATQASQPPVAPVVPTVIPLPPPPVAPEQQAALSPAISVAAPVTPVEPSVKQTPADQTLVEPGAAGLAASAFDRLAQAVEDSVPKPAAPDPGPSVGPSGRNLEDIVKELLRPMLKEWLDKNLPPMVERFVEREIVRLTRR